MRINADYTTQTKKLYTAMDLGEEVRQGNTKVTVLQDISLSPRQRLSKGYEGEIESWLIR